MHGPRSPPKPILQPAPVRLSRPIHHSDPFLYIDRQARQLQNDLQALLDAQSTGLAAGSQASGDDATSTGSLTPTPSSHHGSQKSRGRPIPVRQPPEKKIGLRGARRGILKSMHELLSLREEEQQIIHRELSDRREALKTVDTFESKRNGLQKSIAEIQSDGSVARLEELKGQAKGLEEEIHELEVKLMEMKTRHRHMLSEISELQNSVDSRMSSYKESLSLLDADVKRYLKSPPVEPLPVAGDSPPNFYSLPSKRRTLEMAKEHWTGEQVELRKRKRKVDLEIKALKEGGAVWSKVISDVSAFEKSLAELMRQSMVVPSSSPSGKAQPDIDKTRADEVLSQLDETTTKLENMLKLAEENKWNLLICSIGAELEAFRQAKPLLLSILRSNEREEPDISDNDVPPEFLSARTNDDDPTSPDLDSQGRSESPGPNLSRGETSSPPALLNMKPADADDEPDPAWLLP
ncbi:hypothetical protein VTO42DRAFT_4953 [Malbranchea cinnamomea]